MLGVLGDIEEGPQLGDGTDFSVYATRIVRKLLQEALEDPDLWIDLAPHLRQLAEAAPDTFLTLLEKDLAREKPSVLKLFAPRPGLLSPRYKHSNLLSALQRLAWSPTYFTRVVSTLARLEAHAPETKSGNRPANKLHSFFRLWLPQCGASLEHRFEALDKIRANFPDTAWDLMLRLLPSGQDSASVDSGPGYRNVLWREWQNEAERPTPEDYRKSIQKLSKRVVEDVSTNQKRWLSLISDVHHLDPDTLNEALDHLEDEIQASSDAEWKDALRENLRRTVNHHRAYSDADWAMPARLLNRLEGILDQLETPDPRERHQWLFSERPRLPVDARSYREELQRRRTQALQEITEIGGPQAVVSFAENVDRPQDVGSAYAALNPDESETEQVLNHLDGSGAARNLAEGFVRVASREPEWRKKHVNREILEQWSVPERVSALLQLPSDGKLIDLVEHLGEDTARLFWRKCRGLWPSNSETLKRAAEKWIRYGRPRRAIHRLAMVSHAEDFTIDPDIIQQALNEGLRVEPEENPTNIDPHDVNQLLTYLRQNADDSTSIEGLSSIEHLEWMYLPLIRPYLQEARTSDHHSLKDDEQLLLHRRLSEDPAFFVEVVSYAYKRDSQEEPPPNNKELAKRAHLLLESWQYVPGYTRTTNSINEDDLDDWLTQVNDLLHEKDLVTGGHITIGQMLRWGPEEEDGVWPTPGICNAIEDLSSETVDIHFRTEIFNSRGVTSRDPYAGGAQERALAEKYEGYAKELQARWPRVASILRRLAETYRSGAKRIDRRAEQDQDNYGRY